MLKAIDKTNGCPIISVGLDDLIPSIRELGRTDQLACPLCKESVILKAGNIRIHHFSHRPDSSCPYRVSSSKVLDARGMLYTFLKSRFHDSVDLEHSVDYENLCRPFDCWVETKGKRFAYWIIDKRNQWQVRRTVEKAARQESAELTWVFLKEAFLKSKYHRYHSFSSIEQQCATHTPFDIAHDPGNGKSLFYIDAKEEQLTILRNVRDDRPFGSNPFSCHSQIEDVLICPQTGSFYLSGEREKIAPAQERRRLSEQKQIEEQQKQETVKKEFLLKRDPVGKPQATREGICVCCKRKATEMRWYVGKTKECLCKDCDNQGKLAEYPVP